MSQHAVTMLLRKHPDPTPNQDDIEVWIENLVKTRVKVSDVKDLILEELDDNLDGRVGDTGPGGGAETTAHVVEDELLQDPGQQKEEKGSEPLESEHEPRLPDSRASTTVAGELIQESVPKVEKMGEPCQGQDRC